MKQIPTTLRTDEEKKELQNILKKAGYGHFVCLHTGQVTNMTRGVRIEWKMSTPDYTGGTPTGGGEIRTAHVTLRKAVPKQVWSGGFKGGNTTQITTEYVHQPNLYFVKGHKPKHPPQTSKLIECDSVQDLMEKVVRDADSQTGDKSITQASIKKGLLQNIIFDDVKKRLLAKYKDWSGFGVQFGARAKVQDGMACLRISIPAQSYDRGIGETSSSYQIGELILQMCDGQFDVILGDFHHGRKDEKLETPIPVFADPKFDPELVWEFAIKAIEMMIPVRESCTAHRRAMDLLDIAIKNDKADLRLRFGEEWKAMWYGN